MQVIRNIESFSTEIYPEFDKVNSIEIDDTPLGGGNFGEVYACISINKFKPSVKQVIKILNENNQDSHLKGIDTIWKLQEKLRIKHLELMKNRNETLFEVFPALKAVPQFSFTGDFKGKKVHGYASNDLSLLGFTCFKEILENDTWYNKYESESIITKFQFAYHLVNAFDLLKSMYFVHADIKDEAVYINLKSQELAIIDFDSGAFMEHNNQPTTFGALQDWLAPEIFNQLNYSNGQQGLVQVNLLSDMWSVIVGIHYLIFMTHPLFFLQEISGAVTMEYFSNYKWPDANPNAPYFSKVNDSFYKEYITSYKNMIPTELKKAFEVSINEGYQNPVRREPYSVWKRVLKATQKPPTIKSFNTDKDVRKDASPVTLSWALENASQIILMPNQINLNGKNKFLVEPVKDTTYTLIVQNPFGKVEKSLTVFISKEPPVISSFIADKSIRMDSSPITLYWEVQDAYELFLKPGNKLPGNIKEIKIEPTQNTTYTLIAKSFLGVESKKTLLIKVSDRPPIIREFNTNKSVRTDSRPIKLYWDVENSHKQIINPGYKLVNNKGTTDIEPIQNTIYILEATSLFGVKAQAELVVNVSQDAPNIKVFGYKAMDIVTDEYELFWETENAENISIFPKPDKRNGSNSATIFLRKGIIYTLTAKTIFGIKASETLKIESLFNPSPEENLFFSEPDNSIFNSL